MSVILLCVCVLVNKEDITLTEPGSELLSFFISSSFQELFDVLLSSELRITGPNHVYLSLPRTCLLSLGVS